MKLYLKSMGLQLKQLLLSPKGWLSWIIANIMTSMGWIIPLVIGFILQDTRYYAVAGGVWAFSMSPITPFWLLNLMIATFIYKKVLK